MTGILEIWWVWLALALVLAVAEIFAPGFIFLGFAVGAALTALVVAFSTFGFPVLCALFAILSLVSWLVMRRLFKLPNEKRKVFDTDINDN
ncbi:hypothetical protein TG4357_02580 [Thalassovita gelatinovora]|uniref:NfeD-like C-terminal domain-containing protein n=1 Tax=Thalassovita gelatinovora TaxID=53501 RepID=A0A0P1FG82_THAGE|nr:hypothetical protein [Thalassovita gelatinovora]QIZ79710.1 hypothetical protein HFZ77_04070 [Thalassovita gelatinovora]CUH66692.1 hypothetical protein TG4357_02580 [Thalassovita gelatinovora]SEQ41031.1 NfeD-like C-terminal, partner-binding [Thalassovita gelatinovora]